MSIFQGAESRLQGKTILITGASGGIGAATAVLFAQSGANVVLAARRLANLEEVVKECQKAQEQGKTGKGGKFLPVEYDVKDVSASDKLLAKIKEAGMEVDVLVNNAGLVHGREEVGEISQADIDSMFDTNVRGLIHLTQVFVREFKKRGEHGSGHVINVGSVAGRDPYPGGAIYCATKHAVRSFSSSLLKELVSTDIRVSEVQPGMVETEFSVTRFRGDRDAADKVYHGFKPLVAADIAEEIIWTVSRPPHVNVAEIYVLPSAQGGPSLVARR